MTILSEFFNDAKSMIRIRRKLMARQVKLNQTAPKEGEMAPDFTLYNIGGDEAVTLSDFRGVKPVVLIFGSFT